MLSFFFYFLKISNGILIFLTCRFNDRSVEWAYIHSCKERSERKMGYYGDHSSKKRSVAKKILPAFLGACFGAASVGGTLVYLSKPNVLSVKEHSVSAATTKSVEVHESSDVTNAVNKAADAVVGVSNYQTADLSNELSEASSGSGVIYKKSGSYAYVITNNHVVSDAKKLEISLRNGKKIPAKLLGTDPFMDLAVLRVDGSEIHKVAELGHSDSLKLGEPVVAIGNPLGAEFSGSVTKGIVSGLKRTVPVDINGDGQDDWEADVIQTDAAINPGNSGGALINIEGQVVGINSMKIAQAEVEGIGFSIPISSAIPVVEDLEKYGKVKRPYIGIASRSLDEISLDQAESALKLPESVRKGIVIETVEDGSPASRAGLKPYDVVTKVDNEAISSVADLRSYLYEHKQVGEKAAVTYYRDGHKHHTYLTLQEQH